MSEGTIPDIATQIINGPTAEKRDLRAHVNSEDPDQTARMLFAYTK